LEIFGATKDISERVIEGAREASFGLFAGAKVTEHVVLVTHVKDTGHDGILIANHFQVVGAVVESSHSNIELATLESDLVTDGTDGF